MSEDLPLGGPRDADRLRGRLQNPEALLKRFGALMVRESSQAFQAQEFDRRRWPERYPNHGSPVVNIAGILSDFNRGKSPPSRRFADRPALVDTNELRRSLTYRVNPAGRAVEVGSWLDRASRHQEGGTSTQAVSDDAKANLAAFLRTRRGKPYRKKLGFLFHRETLTTTVHARPFVGLTESTAPTLSRAAARYFATGKAS
jgi:phage gpG-like protein